MYFNEPQCFMFMNINFVIRYILEATNCRSFPINVDSGYRVQVFTGSHDGHIINTRNSTFFYDHNRCHRKFMLHTINNISSNTMAALMYFNEPQRFMLMNINLVIRYILEANNCRSFPINVDSVYRVQVFAGSHDGHIINTRNSTFFYDHNVNKHSSRKVRIKQITVKYILNVAWAFNMFELVSFLPCRTMLR